jgi:SSS family solute:Na+ symporter
MAPHGLLGSIGAFNGYYFSGLLFLISVALVVGVSLLTPPPPESQLAGLTYRTVTAEHRAENRRHWNWFDVVLTLAVLGGVLGMYVYFTGWLR